MTRTVIIRCDPLDLTEEEEREERDAARWGEELVEARYEKEDIDWVKATLVFRERSEG